MGSLLRGTTDVGPTVVVVVASAALSVVDASDAEGAGVIVTVVPSSFFSDSSTCIALLPSLLTSFLFESAPTAGFAAEDGAVVATVGLLTMPLLLLGVAVPEVDGVFEEDDDVLTLT